MGSGSASNGANSIAVVSFWSGRGSPRQLLARKFRYWLSEPAGVTFKIYRRVIGRKVGGRCQRHTRANRKNKRCLLRYRYIGSLKRSGEQGGNHDRFAGKVRARSGKLAPGTYRATAVATDLDGARSSPRSAWFRVAGNRKTVRKKMRAVPAGAEPLRSPAQHLRTFLAKIVDRIHSAPRRHRNSSFAGSLEG